MNKERIEGLSINYLKNILFHTLQSSVKIADILWAFLRSIRLLDIFIFIKNKKNTNSGEKWMRKKIKVQKLWS